MSPYTHSGYRELAARFSENPKEERTPAESGNAARPPSSTMTVFVDLCQEDGDDVLHNQMLHGHQNTTTSLPASY